MDYATPLLDIARDYAIVLRVFDPNTGQIVVTAAGISVFGTAAAAEFPTDPHQLMALGRIPKQKNIEVVLGAEVVRAKSGRPKVLALQIW